MTDKHFFDLLKDKVAELSPSEQHLEADWAALGMQLSHQTAAKKPVKRRAVILPLLLTSALLSSNAMWWHSSKQDHAAMTQLNAEIVELQAKNSATIEAPAAIVRVDTVWKTRYIREVPWAISPSPIENISSAFKKPVITMPEAEPLDKVDTRILSKLSLSNLPLLPLTPVPVPEREFLMPEKEIVYPVKETNTIRQVSQDWIKKIQPKFFTLGANAGWLYANSPALMHEGGFCYNMQGQFGVSRHWSLTANYGFGRVHYKSHAPEAIWGTPDLPTPPSMDHHFAEMDVTGQKSRQFELGLRYTFSQPGKSRPFLGLGWGGQTLLPFKIDYEILHEPSGNLQKGMFEIGSKTRLRNIMGLNAGFEIPLAPGMLLNLEGFYQRQLKKANASTPDLTGFRAGFYWYF